MPAVDTQGAKTGGRRVRVKKKPAPKVTRPTPDQADRNTKPRTPPAPVKVRMYAHPGRKEPQKVITKMVSDEDTAKAKRAETKAVVHSIHVTPVPSPDARDSTRSPAQQAHDRAFTQQSGQKVHTRAVVKGRRTAVRNFIKGGADPVGPVHYTAKAQKARKQGIARRAAVLDVLQETTRPLHGIAAAAKANVHAIKTEGLKPLPLYLQASPKKTLEAATKGLKNEDKSTFSDVLTEAGWKPKSRAGKLAKGAVSLAADIAFDPTTYVTGGTGKVAAKTAEKAASAAEKATAKAPKGVRVLTTAKEARRAASRVEGGGADAQSLPSRAYIRAEKTGDQTKGVVLRYAGHEIPGVRKATAKVSKPVRKAARKATPNKVREGARAVAADLNPNVAPVGVSRDVSDAAIRATRTARSKANRGVHEAQQQALGIKKQVGEANYSRIIDAIENGTIGKLPPELRDAAVKVRSQFRHANRQRKQAGIRGGEVGTHGRSKLGPVMTHDVTRPERVTTHRAVTDEERKAIARRVGRKRGMSTADVLKLDGERLGILNKDVATKADDDRLAEIDSILPEHLPQSHTVHGPIRIVTRTVAGSKGGRATRTTVKDTTDYGGVKEYIPHHLTDEAATAAGHAAKKGPGRRVIRPSSSQGRAAGRQAPLSELRVKFPGEYSEDLPNLYAARKAEGATAVARAELNRRIADLGRAVKKGQDVVLNAGESVYHIVGSDIRKVDAKEVTQVIDKGGKKGRYVVLNDDIVKRAIEGVQPHPSEGIVRGLDKTQAGFKKVALATPGFHLRNIVGDTQNAYLYQPGYRLPKNMGQAARVLKAEGRSDKALRNLTQPTKGKGTIKTARYGQVSYDDVAKHLTEHGGMRSGYTARELPELAHQGTKGPRIRIPRKLRQAALNREDLPRVSTAIEALKHGATWEEAASKVADYHFDYAHLTSFERNIARRGAPFYTFTARNIPLQAKSLVAKPGKFANYEKVREEASKLVGMDEESQKARALTDQLKQAGVKLPAGWEALMSEYEQRNAGIPVRWKGHAFTVSMGLPLGDLNEFPGAALDSQLREYYQKGMSMTSPIPKDIIEYMENHSFFFRDPIERDTGQLVAAPVWVKFLPDDLKKLLGATPNYLDKKTGKTQWGYRAKADYVVKAIPGTPAFVQKLLTPGHDRVGKGTVAKLLAFAGVKATPYDPVAAAVSLAGDREQQITTRQATLRQQVNPANGQLISQKNPTAEYTRLSQQLKIVNQIQYQGQAQQNYKILPKQGGPPKGRSSTRIRLGGGSTGRIKLGGSSGGRIKLGG